MTSTLSERAQTRAEERRWWILAVLCFSLLVIVLDNTILNVAIPTIVRDLDATNSQLQWMVDAYTLVFAGLLLTGGSLGDRFGRRGALQVGLVIFGLGSLASAFATSSGQLIATRAFMGIGGAFIMPATLSIITNVFPPRERGKAIGVWAATAGLAGVLGPLTGGFLLEHFYWGSIFLVNIPIVIVGLLAGVFLIPTSKDPSAPRLDPVGAVLSIVGLSVLLYGIIEAPQDGWTDPKILMCFFVGLAVLGMFLVWEARSDHPMLDVRFFQNARFTAASVGIMMVFFAMFGATFLLTQYFQFVLGYTPLETGIRFLPIALCMMVLSPLSARFVHRLGTKLVVGTGLMMVTAGLVSWASLSASSPYWPDIVWRQALMASGMALDHGPRDRVDHGLVAAGQGRRGLGGERHHPSGRRRAGCRGHRQRAGVDLRLAGGRLPARQAGPEWHRRPTEAVARSRPGGIGQGAGPGHDRGRRLHRRHARGRARRGRGRPRRCRRRVRVVARRASYDALAEEHTDGEAPAEPVATGVT